MDRKSVIIGYVAIPADVDRADHVKYCLQNHIATIRTNEGEFIRDCPIAYGFIGVNEGFIYSLEFPGDPTELGSQVVALNVPKSDIPIIIGCLPMIDGTVHIPGEDSLSFSRGSSEGSFLIEGDGLKGILQMVADGGDQENGGVVSIRAMNEAKSAVISLGTDKFNLHTTKRTEVLSNEEFEVIVKNKQQDDKKASIKYTKGVGLQYKDEWDNEVLTEEGKVYMKEGGSGKVFEIEEGELSVGSEGGSDEAMAMGDTLKEKLEALIDAISQLTVPTPSGKSGTPVNIADFQQIRSELQEILSEIATVDRS